MTSATISSATSNYTYDGDGMRRTRTVGGNTTTYTWHVAGALPVLLYYGTYNYIYGNGLIGRVDGSNNQLWYLSDGLGSTANVRNASGNAVAAYTYDVYGTPTQSGSSDNVFQFTGEQRDSESGYEYLRARYYDPVIGRFLGEDPAGSANRFSYVDNNPPNLVDPTGLCARHGGVCVGKNKIADLAAKAVDGDAEAAQTLAEIANNSHDNDKDSDNNIANAIDDFLGSISNSNSKDVVLTGSTYLGKATLTDLGNGALVFNATISGDVPTVLAIWAFLLEFNTGKDAFVVLAQAPDYGPKVCFSNTSCSAGGLEWDLAHGGILDLYRVDFWAFCARCTPTWGTGYSSIIRLR